MIELSVLAEDSLAELLAAAVTDADPAEVMPPVPGETGWTGRQRHAFGEFHRGRSFGTDRPVETTYLIRRDGRVLGAARLAPTGDGVEAGIWLGRSARGSGAGRAAFAELVALARCRGERRLVAETTTGNAAARALLAGFGGFTSTVRGKQVSATLELSPPLAGAAFLITGVQAAGTSAVAELLAGRLPRAAHVRGDAFRRMVVSGGAEVTEQPTPEALRQLPLRYRLAAGVVDGYAAAGFTAVLQDVVLGAELTAMPQLITTRPLFVVVLAPDADTPTEQTPRLGLWLDTSRHTPQQTVREILAHVPRALV